MARLVRVVVPGYPHHITQRGNRRQQVFFKLSESFSEKAERLLELELKKPGLKPVE